MYDSLLFSRFAFFILPKTRNASYLTPRNPITVSTLVQFSRPAPAPRLLPETVVGWSTGTTTYALVRCRVAARSRTPLRRISMCFLCVPPATGPCEAATMARRARMYGFRASGPKPKRLHAFRALYVPAVGLGTLRSIQLFSGPLGPRRPRRPLGAFPVVRMTWDSAGNFTLVAPSRARDIAELVTAYLPSLLLLAARPAAPPFAPDVSGKLCPHFPRSLGDPQGSHAPPCRDSAPLRRVVIFRPFPGWATSFLLLAVGPLLSCRGGGLRALRSSGPERGPILPRNSPFSLSTS